MRSGITNMMIIAATGSFGFNSPWIPPEEPRNSMAKTPTKPLTAEDYKKPKFNPGKNRPKKIQGRKNRPKKI